MSYRIYHLHNEARREHDFGVTGRPVTERVAEHCTMRTESLRHWDCERDSIGLETLTWRRSRSEASAVAHALEKEAAARGFRVVRTGGV